MATSAVPAAITALLTALRAAPELAEVRIIDGPPPSTNLSEGDRLYVGWSPGAEQAAEIQQVFAGAGARTRDEDATLSCYIETREGAGDMAWCRNHVFDLLAVVEYLLRATDGNPTAPTLGGVVLWSELTAGSLIQEQGPDGAYAGLGFTVAYRARI